MILNEWPKSCKFCSAWCNKTPLERIGSRVKKQILHRSRRCRRVGARKPSREPRISNHHIHVGQQSTTERREHPVPGTPNRVVGHWSNQSNKHSCPFQLTYRSGFVAKCPGAGGYTSERGEPGAEFRADQHGHKSHCP